MSVAQAGGVLPNGNWVPEFWSTKALTSYYSAQVVPHISNHDYDGEITKVGDTVHIPKRPSIQIFDGVDGADLEVQQDIADDYTDLTIDYFKYFNLKISDIKKFQNSLDIQNLFADQAAVDLGTKVEQHVLQNIYSSADSVISAGSFSTSTGLDFILQAELAMNELSIPDDGQRFLILPARALYKLEGSDLKAAYLTGEGSTTLRRGTAQVLEKPLGSFNRVYMTNNLSWTTTTAHAIAGHMDALAFASQINDVEILRDPRQFGWILRGKIVYGFKVVQPKALVHINITSYV